MNSRSDSTNPQQPIRNMSMNTYGSQPTRQGPRLQNTQKSSIGTGLGGAGWGMAGVAGGFGAAAPSALARTGGAELPGAPRPGLSGFAQVMGGGSGQAPINMSDFPSLSGGSRQQQQANAATASWNSNTIRQQTQQAPPSAQAQQDSPSNSSTQQVGDQFDGQRSVQQPSGEQNGNGEEFPPLGGQTNGESLGQHDGFGSGLVSPDVSHARPNGQQMQMPIREAGASLQQSSQGPIGSVQGQGSSQNATQPAPGLGMKKYADMTETEKWGLPGLMAAFEARRQMESGGPVDLTIPASMRNAIFMGQDLSGLGLDLDSPDPLYPSFTPFPALSSSGSQFDFHDRHMVPDFTLPSAYTVTNVPPLSSRLNAFSDETLFSVFYQHPRDILQELAAMELTVRDWRWHKVLRQWLQKDTRESNTGSSLPIFDLATNAPVGTQPVRMGDRTERGVYVFFDAMNWRRERREFILDYEQLDHRHQGNVGGAGVSGPPPPGMGGPVGTQNLGAIRSQGTGA